MGIMSKAFPGLIPNLVVLGNASGNALQSQLQQQMANAQAQQNRMLEQRGMLEYQRGVFPGKLPKDIYFDVKLDTKKTTSCPCGKCRIQKDFNRDAVMIYQTAECWLTERVEKVRLLGRNWDRRSVKRLDAQGIASALGIPYVPRQAPPAIGGQRIPNTDGIPTLRTKGGDLVYVYPEDHNLPF